MLKAELLDVTGSLLVCFSLKENNLMVKTKSEQISDLVQHQFPLLGHLMLLLQRNKKQMLKSDTLDVPVWLLACSQSAGKQLDGKNWTRNDSTDLVQQRFPGFGHPVLLLERNQIQTLKSDRFRWHHSVTVKVFLAKWYWPKGFCSSAGASEKIRENS